MTEHNILYFNKFSLNAHLHKNEGGFMFLSVCFLSLSLRNVIIRPLLVLFRWTLLSQLPVIKDQAWL